MNYKRWAIVGFVAGLAIFSFWHLANAGSDYRELTTSDSGFFYGIAEDINQEDGFIENYELSHPPQGKPVPKNAQFQPLMLVTLYRGLNAVDPGITLTGVAQYFSPFLFALTVIGAFLAARELGGDLAGCASALFFSSLVGSIYWTKIGAFDREITLIFFGTWIFYLFIKTFKAPKGEMLKYSALGGILYGMFLTTWIGAPFLGVIVALALFLIVFERSVSGLGLTIVSIILIVLGMRFPPFDVPELLGIFLLLAGITKIGANWEDLNKLENKLFDNIRSNIRIIGGVLGMVGIATLVAITLGGAGSDFWINLFSDRIPAFLGAGGEGGVSFPRIATEMAPAPPEPGKYLTNGLDPKLYGNSFITGLTITLVSVGLIKTFWSSKRAELLALAALIIILPMPLSQARFFRLFWPLWPVLAGFGFGALIWMVRKIITSSAFLTSDWVKMARQPLVLALVGLVLTVPLLHNAREETHASDEVPYPHGASLPTIYYKSLLDSFHWIENDQNTSENSVLAIPWSYGHFATGATGRPSVTDGAQNMGWRGEWRDSPGIKPPDYIKYVSENGDGKIIGKNAPSEPYAINGRRIDIQRMYTMGDENELSWILNTYRENFGINMDYIIFNNWVSRGMTFFFSSLYSMQENYQRPQSLSQEGMNWILQFGEENIVFNTYGFSSPTTQENNERLGGMILLNKNGGLLSYSFTPSPEVQKILWVFYDSQNRKPVGGLLAEFDGVPMVMRALREDRNPAFEMPGYLRQVQHGPTKWASSSRIGPSYQSAVYRVARIPKPKYPENMGLINDNTLELEWDESVDGVRYEVTVDDNPDFESPEITAQVKGTTYVLEESIPDDNYYWRVKAFDEDNETKGWSTTYKFELDTVPPGTPELNTPENEATLTENMVEFTWGQVEGAERYRLQVDDNVSFGSKEVNRDGIENNSYQVTDPGLENGVYYWRVRAFDKAGNGSDWSEVRTFTLES